MEPRKKRPNYLPRLPREYYQADAVVHWSLPTFNRAKGWLNDRFHQQFRETMLHAQSRESILCPVYCLNATTPRRKQSAFNLSARHRQTTSAPSRLTNLRFQNKYRRKDQSMTYKTGAKPSRTAE